MNATLGAVLFVGPRTTHLAHALEAQLAHAGFEVVRAADPRRFSELPRGRAWSALVVPSPGIMGPSWRRWTAQTDLGGVPVVAFGTARRHRPSAPWPLGAFIRADAYVNPGDLRRGAVPDVVRGAAARGGGGPPTTRRKLGEIAWYLGSASWGLAMLGGLAMAFALVFQMITRQLGAVPVAIPGSVIILLLTSDVLLDLGASVGLDELVSLRWSSWIKIAVLVGLVALFAWGRHEL